MTKNAKRELGGQEWERLGFPVEEETPIVGTSLSWETLLPFINQTKEQKDPHHLRMTVVCSDGMQDPEQGLLHVQQVESTSVVRLWLLFQSALQLRSLELFNEWFGKTQDLTEGQESKHLRTYATFCRSMLCNEKYLATGEEDSSSPAIQIGYQVLLSNHQRWADLASILKDGSTVSKLIAAHLLGDLLGRYERQADLLRQTADEVPLLAAETLLELALRGEGGEELVAALERRYAILQHEESCLAEAAATATMLQMKRGGQSIERPPLKDAQAVVAWRHLDALLDRVSVACEPGKLAFQYLEESKARSSFLMPVLLLRAAELFMAQNVWGKALGVLPDVTKGHRLLFALVQRYKVLCYCQLQAWDELAKVLTQLANYDAPEDKRLFLQMATIAAMKQPADTHAHLRQIQNQVEQLDDEAITSLSWVLMCAYREAGLHDHVASLWSALFERAKDEADTAFFSFAVGVAQLKASRLDLAQAAFHMDRTISGNSATTLAGLAITQSLKQKWPEVVEILSELAELVDDAAAVMVLREAAYCAVVRAKDVDKGLHLIEKALEKKSDDLNLLQEGVAIYLRKGRYKETCKYLERAVEIAGESEMAADLLNALGEVLQEKVGDLPVAEDAYRRALKIHPLHPGAIRGLSRLLVKVQRYQDLPPLLYSLLQLAETDAARMKILLELASLHSKLWEKNHSEKDADSCIQCCDQALKMDPENEEAIKRLVAICQQLQRWKDITDRIEVSSNSLPGLRGLQQAFEATSEWPRLAAVSRRLAEKAVSTRERLAAALKAGDIYYRKLDDLAAAEECYRWASKRFKDLAPLQRLADLLRSQDRAADLAKVLEQELASAPPKGRLPLLLELGRLYAGPLNTLRSAIQHFEAAVELEATNEEALRTLEVLHEEECNYTDLARVLEKLLGVVEGGDEELRVALKLGGVYGELKDDRSMLRMASRVRRQFPSDPKAMAFAEEVYRRQGRYSDLCELYERRIQLLESQSEFEGEVAVLLERKGNIELNELGAVPEAIESLTRVIELRPEDGETLSLLERALSESGDWQRLLSVYEKRANHLKEQDDQIASLQKAARIAAQQLNDEAESVRLYERIHALDPSDAESFSFLERKLERRADFKRLVDLLLDRAERVQAVRDKVECIVRSASICEQLNDVARAKELYKRALKIDPSSRRSLEALARIYESQEAWREFIEVTRQQIKLETKSSAKALLYFKCGSVVETKYHQEKDAAKYYTQAIKTSPSCLPAIHSLRELYARRQDWKKVLETLSMEVKIWTDDKGRADVLSQIAEIYATKLNDTSKALYFYRKAIETHPENMPAALALFDACASQGFYTEAVAWGDVYARQVQKKGSQAQRADFFVKWADVLRRVGRYKEAAKYLVRALGIRPGRIEALYGLLDLCRESPESYDFSRAFSDLLKDASKREDSMAQAIISTGLGVLAEHRSEINTALDLYKRALKVAGGDQIRLAKPMADLLVMLGTEEEAVQLVDRCRLRGRETTVAEWVEAVLWLVDHELIWRRDFGRAVELCRDALEEQPNRADVRLRLARAELLLNRPERAQAEYQQICDQMAKQGMDPIQLAKRWHALGLAAQKAGNHKVAEASWFKAIDMAPQYPYPYFALVRTYLTRGEHEAAARLMDQAKDKVQDGSPDLQRSEAELLVAVGKDEESVEIFKNLSHEPGEMRDRVRLSRCLVKIGEVAESVDLLREAIHHQIDYVPALEELQLVWTGVGQERMARRAAQVIDLALGNGAGAKPSTVVSGPFTKEIWSQLSEGLSNHPLEPLWRMLSRFLDRRFQVDQPKSIQISRPEINLAAAQMAALFGKQLEVVQAQDTGPLWRLFGHWLIVAPEVAELGINEFRFMLAMALTATKSSHDLLLRYTQEERLELGMTLASVLTREKERPDDVKEMLASLSRREQRQAAKHAGQHEIGPKAKEELARSWLTAIESLCIQVALLVTDELGALVRILGLQHGIPPVLLGKGGLLTTLPDLSQIVDYFISDTFNETRTALGAEGKA